MGRKIQLPMCLCVYNVFLFSFLTSPSEIKKKIEFIEYFGKK